MDVLTFLELFIKELEINPGLREYYRLLNHKGRYYWRKAYLEQRLEYVDQELGIDSGKIWDVGCGYATTAIFLSLKGFEVFGNTLEFYYDKISRRLDYWSRFGDISHLRIEHSDHFDKPFAAEQFDAVIAQDTLHHLEPIQEAVQIISASLKSGGRLVVTEENGHHPFIILRNFAHRGFRKVTAYYDERLQKTIMFGDENARSFGSWQRILKSSHLVPVSNHAEYMRALPPCCFSRNNYYQLIKMEKMAGKNLPGLREFLFFGINFTAIKQS
jgi:SAM-dependent methyltransferase